MRHNEYFLYALVYRYVDFYNLPDPCDDIERVLDFVARRLGALMKGLMHYYTCTIDIDTV